jgi:CBS domain containing-hemolysin-like protein
MPIDAGELELTVRIVLQIVLLTSSAVFSGSETALFSLSRIDLQKLRNARDPDSESIHAMLDEPRRLIISILCGNELVNIASSANMTAILLMLFGQDAGWINILVMVPLLLLVGEVTPKTIAVNHPIGFSKGVSARLLPKWIAWVTPLREAVRLVADRVTTFVVGEVVARENILQPDELKTLLEEGEETGIIDATERVLIDNLLEASDTEISHVMTPGPRIRFLDAGRPLPELIQAFRRYQHPRVPVYSGHWDNVIGFLHSEDVLRLVRGGADLDRIKVQDVLRPAHFVAPTIKVDEMFDFFQSQNTRAVIVLGEFGEVLGIVTIKDVLKFIFGEITSPMRSIEDYERDEVGYIVPGDMRLLDFYNLTNIDIEDPVMTTIGGVIFRLFGHLPKVGEHVTNEAYRFTVLEVERLRIRRLRVSKIDTQMAEEIEEETAPPSTEDLDRPMADQGGQAGAKAKEEASQSPASTGTSSPSRSIEDPAAASGSVEKRDGMAD